MQLKVIQTLEEFDSLADEWNRLLDCSASHVPFLRHEYLAAWWRTLGGGEWPHGELYVVTARRADGGLCAVAPLFFTENREGEPALMLLGSIEISDYLDVLICPDDASAFAEALFDHLQSPQAPPWKVLDFYNIQEGSPTLQVLQSAAESCGWIYAQERLQHCPYIPLPGDWETYLAGIDKKQRHEIRRKMRRAEELRGAGALVYRPGWRAAGRADRFLPGSDGAGPGKKAFLTEAMRTQMRAAMHAAFAGGWLQLAFLDVGGEKAAAYLNFDYGDHIWVYNSGLDFKHSAVSPGWVLLGYLLQWANENKRRAFDFMRGDEEYKYRFGAVDRFIVRLTIRRP